MVPKQTHKAQTTKARGRTADQAIWWPICWQKWSRIRQRKTSILFSAYRWIWWIRVWRRWRLRISLWVYKRGNTVTVTVPVLVFSRRSDAKSSATCQRVFTFILGYLLKKCCELLYINSWEMPINYFYYQQRQDKNCIFVIEM